MSFLAFRDAVIADLRANLVITRLNPARPFLACEKAPRRVDEDWLQHVVVKVPSIHVCFIGNTKRVQRHPSGQFTGSWAMIAHIVTGQRGVTAAEDQLLDKLYTFMNYVEGKNFAFPGAGPAQVTDIENLWDVRIDEQGYAIGSIAWEHDILFGTDRAAAAMAAEMQTLYGIAPTEAPTLRELWGSRDGEPLEPALPEDD